MGRICHIERIFPTLGMRNVEKQKKEWKQAFDITNQLIIFM